MFEIEQNVNRRIKCHSFTTVGVIETGLFVNMASKAYFSMPDGSVVSRLAPACNGNGMSDSSAEH